MALSVPEEAVGDLLEREGEIAQLSAALARAQAGSGSCLMIEGAAGIGKTGLLGEAARIASERGIAVLSARGGELERDFAFGITRRLFERELVAAPPELRDELLAGSAAPARPAIGLDPGGVGSSGEPDAGAVLHGLYWLAANLSSRGPLLIAVDDVHWSDTDSLRFFAYLGARAAELPLVLLLTARPREPGAERALVDQLRALPECEQLRPAPLTVGAATSIVGSLLDSEPEEAFARACHEATGGNPFLLRELASALREDGSEGSASDADRVRNLGPDTVARSLLLRLARMPAAAGSIAASVAVLGNDADLSLAAALAGIDRGEAETGVDSLVDADILAPESPLNFVHPVIRSAVYSDLGPGERSALHARAAKLLTSAGAEPELVASHLLHTSPAGESSSVSALRAAAAAALQRGGADAAVRYLNRAAAEGGAAAEDGELLRELGEAEYAAGADPERARVHLRAAIPRLEDPRSRAAAWLALSRTTMNYVGVPEAVAVLEEALEDLPDLDHDDRTRLEVELNTLAITHADTYERAAARMDSLADVPGETTAERLVLCNLAYRSGMTARSRDRTLELARRALGRGSLTRAEGLASNAIHQTNYVLVFCGAYDEAIAECDIALASAVARASAWNFAGASGTRGGIHYFAGDVPACEADIRQALGAPGCPPFAVPYLAAFLAQALLERGEIAEADAAIERAWPEPDLPAIVHMELLLWSRGRVRAAQGRHSEALADLLAYGARSEHVGARNPGIPWRADAALVHLALGETQRARSLASEHLELSERWGDPAIVGNALRASGLVRGGDAGIEMIEAAVDELAPSHARLEHARAIVDLGALQRRCGRRKVARDSLREGLEAARACGATALVERAHEELIAAGARPRRLMFSGLEALTASERRVAAMAADGMSNREIAQALFVTTKTVENHLSRAYGKLGIHSRRELAGAMSGPS